MYKLFILGFLSCVLFAVSGCEQEGGLATESGEMTIEEYEELNRQMTGEMAQPDEAMAQ